MISFSFFFWKNFENGKNIRFMSFLQSSKARSARQSFLGIKQVPDDPLAHDREEIDRAGDTIDVFQSCVQDLEAGLLKLSRVNDELIGCLVECGLGREQTVRDLKFPREAFSAVHPKLGATKMTLHALCSRTQMIRSKLKQRDKLYWEKAHYESKLANLSDEDKLNNERVERNVKKRSKAITDFAETEKDFFEAQDYSKSFPAELSVCVSMYADFFEGLLARPEVPVPSRPVSPDSSRYPSIS